MLMPHKTVEVEGLYKSFGTHAIFEDAQLALESGTVFGVVGLNGSGKTTFIRLLLGLLRPARGVVRVLGFEPWIHKPEYYRRLGVILEHDGFAGNLTVARNLRLFADAKGIPWKQVEAYVDEHWNTTFIHGELRKAATKVKYLSRGQKMQCGICRAFLSWPDAYFFDEPTVALDVDAIDHFYSLVRTARSRGATVLISSHQLPAIEELCDGVGMLHNRRISIITTGGRTKTGSWLVRCAADERYRAIIEEACGFPAEHHNDAWHFPVARPEAVIPAMISALVQAGCEITEVRQDSDSIKDRMRTISKDAKGS